MKEIFIGTLSIIVLYLIVKFLKGKNLKKKSSTRDRRELIYTNPEDVSKNMSNSPFVTARKMKKLELSEWRDNINRDILISSSNEELFLSLRKNQLINISLFDSLNDILKKSLEHHKDFEEYEFIPKPSLPILFFGDIEAYSNENFKILTVALNPSDIEFRTSKNGERFSFFRFPLYGQTSGTLYLSLKDYFIHNPYKKWFDSSYKELLRGLGYSFYNDKLKTAIHTDIVSPLATNPTWTKLKRQKRYTSEIQNLEKIGFDLWLELIEILKPNLILMSLAKNHLTKLNLEYISEFDKITIKKGNSKRKKPYITNLYKLNLINHSCYLIHSPSGINPFRLISNEEQRQLGEKIRLKLIENKMDFPNKQNSNDFISSSINLKIEIKRNFILSKGLMGKGLLIQIGEGSSKIVYDHDLLLNDLGSRITELPCWNKYGYYTKTGGDIPNFCKGRNAILEYNLN